MSAYWSSVEGRARGRTKPLERPRRPQALTFLFTFLQPVTFAFLSTLQEQPMHAATRKHPYRPSTASAPEPPPSSPPQLENIFIDALVRSCACQKQMWPALGQSLVRNPTHLYHKARRRYQDSGRQVRHLHGKTTHASPPALRALPSREEYISIVDIYRESFSTKTKSADSEPFRLHSKFEISWALDRMPQLPEPVSEASHGVSIESQPERWKPPELPEPVSEASNGVSIESQPERWEPPDLPEPVSEASNGVSTESQLERWKPPELPEPVSEASNGVSIESQSERWKPPKLPKPAVSSEPSASLDSEASSHNEPEAVAKLLTVLKDGDCTHEVAFEAYSALPFPGVSYLSDEVKRLLFRRMSVMKRKNKDSMLRYLSVVDDMKSADLPMTEAEWNSAIAFCGQCFSYISAADMESALRTWKEMEQEAAVRSGNVTFNILFDMAAKAGKFVLAEMILKEMEARLLSFNRYTHVSYIFYNGLRADGDGVRKAYREFVEAGEIVTTVVLNCVIASLIRAGEPAAAEQVYERMKRMLAKYTGESIPYLDWKQTRHIGKILAKAARNFKHEPVKLEQLRDEQLLAPDLQTFAIFMEYHATQTGEFLRVVALLTEMQHLGMPMNGRIFVKIFKGFALHGGNRYSKWTTAHLESVWNAYLEAVDQGCELRIMKWNVVWSVRAFDRCASRNRTLEVWGELRRRWEPDDYRQVESALGILEDILNADQI